MTQILERTVLFADLRGSTSLYESLGNARATEVVTQSVSMLSRTVKRCDGTVVKTLGDGLMSVFVFDRTRRNGMIVLVGGTSTDPFSAANKGQYSSLARFQERILTALYNGAIT